MPYKITSKTVHFPQVNLAGMANWVTFMGTAMQVSCKGQAKVILFGNELLKVYQCKRV